MDIEQSDGTEITIPDRIIQRVENRVPYTDFESPEEYISYVLEEVLYRVEEDTVEDEDSVNEEEVKQRLKSLGYLDN